MKKQTRIALTATWLIFGFVNAVQAVTVQVDYQFVTDSGAISISNPISLAGHVVAGTAVYDLDATDMDPSVTTGRYPLLSHVATFDGVQISPTSAGTVSVFNSPTPLGADMFTLSSTFNYVFSGVLVDRISLNFIAAGTALSSDALIIPNVRSEYGYFGGFGGVMFRTGGVGIGDSASFTSLTFTPYSPLTPPNPVTPIDPDPPTEPEPSPVPAPAALPLFLSGLAGMGLVARRRKKLAA